MIRTESTGKIPKNKKQKEKSKNRTRCVTTVPMPNTVAMSTLAPAAKETRVVLEKRWRRR
jgi:hypothetical protein